MNNPLKYRFWDKDNDMWIMPESDYKLAFHIHKDNIWVFEDAGGSFIPSQFTGFLDKNKKEIYEGDILKNNKGEITDIVYENGCWVSSLWAMTPIWNCWEIIGNIYENPKLMEKRVES